MVRKLRSVAVSCLLLAAGWFFLKNYALEGSREGDSPPASESEGNSPFAPITEFFRNPTGEKTRPTEQPQATPAVEPDKARHILRIASYNIQTFGKKKSTQAEVMEHLAAIIRRFDVIAIQEIRDKDKLALSRLVERVNAAGVDYAQVIGPRIGRGDHKEQYAFVYNRATLEVDATAIYTIHDPDDVLAREPLVAAFRARGVPSHQAFTFTLINIHTDPDETSTELNVLDDVFHAVRQDGRGEDDIILLGDLNVDAKHLGQLGQVQGIRWVFDGVSTMAKGDNLNDNILFHDRATVEFTGTFDVVDLVREGKLTREEVLSLSDHLPIWAEFSVYEGGPGPIAARSRSAQ